ncbi:MAG: ATP-binding protein [Verrucomicrobia bacterium]|nr:ATP-binding protein [Verrucomicrobiota bacterium]
MITPLPDITRVLVVDDVRETAKVIEIILRNSGNCTVTHSDHPSKAISQVTSGEIDLVLCETFDESESSFIFCRKLKEDPEFQHVPVILYSAIQDRQTMMKGFEAGAVDYLFKPFFPMELAARVKTHFQLKRQKDLTMGKVNEQRELIHIMCHDLTGPIGASLTLLELCRDEPDILTEHYESVVNSLKKAIELTNMVRQLQAVEDGIKEWVLNPLNLKEAIADAASVFTERMERKGIAITEEIDPDIFVKVERISFINSVVGNLLSNAVKFSMEKSTITFTARKEDDKVIFTVADTGIGMPQTIVDNLFNLTVPTSRKGTSQETGTGYGMPLVKKFVLSYHGEIQVFSNDIKDHPEDHGSRIQLTLEAG